MRVKIHLGQILGVVCCCCCAFAASSFAQVRDEDLPKGDRPTDFTVTGHVVNSKGKAVSGAQVIVVASERGRSARPTGLYIKNGLPFMTEVIGPVATDENGEYRIAVPKSPSGFREGLDLYAAAKGHGYIMQQLEQHDQSVDLELPREHVVLGRLVDLKGQPVPDAFVRVLLHKPGKDQPMSGWWRAQLRGWHPHGIDPWEVVRSDDKGRFVVRGQSSEMVNLQFEGIDITSHEQSFTPTPTDKRKVETVSLSPAKTITGRVTFEDTGKPAANAHIIVPAAHILDGHWIETRTDENGHYSVNPFAIKSGLGNSPKILNVFPPEGTPYMVEQVELDESRAALRKADIKLRRGVLVRGRVTETGTGKPVEGARIQCSYAQSEQVNPRASEPSRLQVAISESDGSYQLAVPRERCFLYVLGPTLDYVPVRTSWGELKRGKPGEFRIMADAVVVLDPKKDEKELTEDIEIQRGVTLHANVVGIDGKPAKSFLVATTAYNPNGYGFMEPHFVVGKNGTFQVTGCDPSEKHVVSILDQDTDTGTTTTLTGESTNSSATIRLEPCGKLSARLLDDDGKPIAGYRPHLDYVIADGVKRTGNYSESPLFQVGGPYMWLHGKSSDTETDKDGRMTTGPLVPGLKYEFSWMPNIKSIDDMPENMPQFSFTVNAGEHKQLGNVTLEGHPGSPKQPTNVVPDE